MDAGRQQPSDRLSGRRSTVRQQRAAARRAQILEVALRLFAAQGFDATSTKQIAREAGIAEGLIFHYFPTKASLLAALLETRHSFIGELRALLDGAEKLPARDVLYQVASGWLATLRRETRLTVVLFGTAQTNPEVGEALRELIQEGTGRLAGYLSARVQAGELREDLPLGTAALTFFSSLMVFFLTHRHLPEQEWQVRSETHARELLALWLDGGKR